MSSDAMTANGSIEKVSIIVSKGSLEGVYPALIMANGARAEGIEANLFFTFFGLDAIHKARHEHIKLATVGNPGLHLATWAGGLPGVSSVMTHYMAHKMGELDIPPVPEFIEMIADTGAGLYACKASVDLFGLTRERLHRPGQGHHHRRRVLRSRRPAARSSSPDRQGPWRCWPWSVFDLGVFQRHQKVVAALQEGAGHAWNRCRC
jgi:peroxiredoxin family protein